MMTATASPERIACLSATSSRKVRQGGAFYVFSPSGRTESSFRLVLQDVGLELRQSIVWAKQAFVLSRQDYHWQHETILYGWKAGAAHHFGGGRRQSIVWQADRPLRNKLHPTMKPLPLLTRAITNSSLPGGRAALPHGRDRPGVLPRHCRPLGGSHGQSRPRRGIRRVSGLL